MAQDVPSDALHPGSCEQCPVKRDPAMMKNKPFLMQILMVSGMTILGAMSGCATTQADDLAAANAAYDRGDFKTAYAKSTQIVMLPTSTPDNAGQAMYRAGMSAYRLNDLPNAQMHLERAIQSHDPQLSATAKAMLGLVSSQQGLYDKAASNFIEAAEVMQGQDKANAYFYAGVAQQKSGRWPQARINLSMAMSTSRDELFRQRVRDQMKITGYTLQLGAFGSAEAAKKLADQYTVKSADLKLGVPRVVPATDPDGKAMYLVQVGQFTSYPTAIQWRDQLGASAATVTGLTTN